METGDRGRISTQHGEAVKQKEGAKKSVPRVPPRGPGWTPRRALDGLSIQSKVKPPQTEWTWEKTVAFQREGVTSASLGDVSNYT